MPALTLIERILVSSGIDCGESSFTDQLLGIRFSPLGPGYDVDSELVALQDIQRADAKVAFLVVTSVPEGDASAELWRCSLRS